MIGFVPQRLGRFSLQAHSIFSQHHTERLELECGRCVSKGLRNNSIYGTSGMVFSVLDWHCNICLVTHRCPKTSTAHNENEIDHAN